MKERIFVGEKRSNTAIEKDWEWKDGRLAAKQLFDALEKIGIDPQKQIFVNLWGDDGEELDVNLHGEIEIIAMGNKVSKELTRREVEHTKIVHPAARGIIRKKEEYQKHIKNEL